MVRQSVAFEWFGKSKGLKLIFSSDTNWVNMNLGKLWEIVRDKGKPGVLQSMGSQRVRHDLATGQQQSTQ